MKSVSYEECPGVIIYYKLKLSNGTVRQKKLFLKIKLVKSIYYCAKCRNKCWLRTFFTPSLACDFFNKKKTYE